MSVEMIKEDVNKKVEEHEKRLDGHDREIGRLDKRTIELQKQVNESLVRVDESNKFLREQNMRQMEQNSDILNAVLDRNSDSDKRKHEIRVLNWSNFWKVAIVIAGTTSILTYLLDKIFN